MDLATFIGTLFARNTDKYTNPWQIAQPFAVELPASSREGFLGSPLGLRSSTRARSKGVTSGRPSPTK